MEADVKHMVKQSTQASTGEYSENSQGLMEWGPMLPLHDALPDVRLPHLTLKTPKRVLRVLRTPAMRLSHVRAISQTLG